VNQIKLLKIFRDVFLLKITKNRFQLKRLSVNEHDASVYSKHAPDSLIWEDYTIKQRGMLNNPILPLNDIFKWQKSFDVIFDLGSGHGWLSDYLSSFGKQVFAIEPSLLANEIARVSVSAQNVTLINSFAEDFLKNYTNRNEETLFVTQSVLQHLSDRTVIKILSQINTFPNAYLCFAEPYSEGFKVNQGTTNIRTKDFYCKHLSEYDLYFSGIDDSIYFGGNTVHKGFYGRTKSKIPRISEEALN